jgi:tRNA U34 5-carboxymethylaminomethyl modifying enzyme MnmG/GidA
MEDESLLLDPQMDYSEVAGLSSEVRERLFAVRPTTVVCGFRIGLSIMWVLMILYCRVLRNEWRV